MIFLTSLLNLFLTGVPVDAQSTAGKSFPIYKSTELTQLAQSIPKDLLENGVKNIGALPLEKLLKEIESVQFETGINMKGHGTGQFLREGGFNIEGKARIHAGALFDKGNDCQAAGLVLHEALGALGYGDRNYELSAPMMALSPCDQSVNSNMLEEALRANGIFKAFGDVKKSDPGTGGGITGAGGGGDGGALQVKSHLLANVHDWSSKWKLPKSQRDEMFEAVLQLRVESAERDSEELVYMFEKGPFGFDFIWENCIAFSGKGFPGTIVILPVCVVEGIKDPKISPILTEFFFERIYVYNRRGAP